MTSVETTTTNHGLAVSAMGHHVSDVRDKANLEILDNVLEGIENDATTGMKYEVPDVGTTSSIGFDFVDAFLGKAIQTGTYQSTASGGITLTSANNRPVSFLFDDAGAALVASDYRPLLSRVLLTLDQPGQITLSSIRGQLKLLNLIDVSHADANLNGVASYLELEGTGARTLTGRMIGVRSAVGADADIVDGSLYLSCEATGGALFLKVSGTWTKLTT